ncbi:MAG: hypothetical protein P9L92_20805 [Candidatus Electryonea clarkiae]|nr:hypothetical protein [Candidatus Electryonea clarkiae]MDP8288527.1 hypothetical protein [Candidatus Electryonea clarkiae]
MNTGQTMLTMGAMILISIIILNFYRMTNSISSSLDFSRFRLESMSIMTSHVEQLSQYFFDEASTDTLNSKELNDFVTPGNLGFDGNDNGIVDDIDDFHGLTVSDTGMSGVPYNVNYSVSYVELQNNLIVVSNSREYHKQISISISDAFNPPLIYSMVNGVRVRDTLRISYVVSYWFYN